MEQSPLEDASCSRSCGFVGCSFCSPGRRENMVSVLVLCSSYFLHFFFFLSKGNRFFSLKVNGEVWLDLHDNGCVSRENWISLCASPNKSFRFPTEKQCYRYKILTVSIDFFYPFVWFFLFTTAFSVVFGLIIIWHVT